MDIVYRTATPMRVDLSRNRPTRCEGTWADERNGAYLSCRITNDSSNSVLFNNRAFSRLRLRAWDSAIDDCLTSISLQPNLKAYYYLAQAQLELHHPNEALSSALTAYEMCLQTPSGGGIGSTNLTGISALILSAKREKWQRRERDRLRRRGELVVELEERLWAARETEVAAIQERVFAGELDDSDAREEIEIVEELSRRKVEEVKDSFAIAHPDNIPRRDVPDYLIDNITFAIMHDPVISPHPNEVQDSQTS
ncbi:MAG: hypothetical protein M1837_000270 [Sclerophora amabilis]|nr:MAG: hypothetical protein M1837_000270 [Sclerophora amabilis]